MKVSFDGKWYDVDLEEDDLRHAIRGRAIRLTAKMNGKHKEEALIEVLASATLIAVKLGATAGLHHAYQQPVDHELVDTYAHVLNRLVGLNYTPPDPVNQPEEANDSGTQEESAG